MFGYYLDNFASLHVNKYTLLTKREVKMAGYWSSFIFFCVFMDRDDLMQRSFLSKVNNKMSFKAGTRQLFSVKYLFEEANIA